MYLIAFLFLAASFLCAVFLAGLTVLRIMDPNRSAVFSSGPTKWQELGQVTITGLMSLSSVILLYAFISYDFSVKYVAQYSDTTLPLFYRITAFWAGQAGSMLFWAWSVAISGTIFCFTGAYRNLSEGTRLWYHLFFLCIMAFFLLLLTTWSNPFEMISPPPADGNGLNPLLQNPGMIFHPPLLFLGYGGFCVPGCLALAQALTGNLIGREREESWGAVTRPFILIAWVLLTAGIILGAWWAYMELGWGGYWAWDPVENASLIPWLIASAYLHTAVIETRRGKLYRTNVLLMTLTTASAFFATYLVRSGVVESLHAFGDGGVGIPLLIFTLGMTVIAFAVALFSRETTQPMGELFGKEGLLLLVSWLLLALGVLILVATMWPVIINGVIAMREFLPASWAAGLPAKPMGLEPAFYNRTCLPLFTGLAFLLLFCPFLKWRLGTASAPGLLITLVTTVCAVFGLYLSGFRHPLATAGAAIGLGAGLGLFVYFGLKPSLLKIRTTLAAHGVHLGVLCMVVGVAFSGPHQREFQLDLAKGESFKADEYTITLAEIYEGKSRTGVNGIPSYEFLEADLKVTKNGKPAGSLSPQLRIYATHQQQPFTEVDTIFSLGNELYATLSGLDNQNRVHVNLRVNPLVNWLWLGGIIMCLFPFLGLARPKRVRDADEPAKDAA